MRTEGQDGCERHSQDKDGHGEHLNGYPVCVAKAGGPNAGTGGQEEPKLKPHLPGEAVRGGGYWPELADMG